MPRAVAPTNPETLIWARESAGYETIDAAVQAITYLRNKADGHADLVSWEKGESKPSVVAAERLAKAYGVSKPFLYLPLDIAKEQTDDLTLIKDFRRDEDRKLTPNTIRFLRDVKRRQNWLRDMLKDETKPVGWQGEFKGSKPIEIAKWLNKKIRPEQKVVSALSAWIEKSEFELGIFVMQSRPSSHHYKVESSFSGCALPDEYVPVVALNAADTQGRRIFTLIHEIAHLAIGEEGISKVEYRLGGDLHSETERFCNEVATQTLMPKSIFLAEWRQISASAETKNVFPKVAKKFGVSMSACVVRASQLDLMEYNEARNWLGLFDRSFKQRKTGNSKPVIIPQSIIARDRAGPSMTRYALQAYDEGRLSSMDLHDIFGVKLNNLPSIAERIGHELVRWQGQTDRE